MSKYPKMLLKLKDKLDDEAKELWGFYDKAILYLAAGGIVLSIAFVKDIIGVDSIKLRSLLIASWVSLTFSVMFILSAYLASQRTNLKLRDVINEELVNARDSADHDVLIASFVDRYNKTVNNGLWTRRFNNLAAITFFVGLTSIVAFSIVNIWK